MMERKVTTPGCLFQFSSKLPAKAKKYKNLHWTSSCSIELGMWEVLQSAYIPPVLIVKLLVSLTRHYYPFIICAKYRDEPVNWVYIACFPGCQTWSWSSGRMGQLVSLGFPIICAGSELLCPRRVKPNTSKGLGWGWVCFELSLMGFCGERERENNRKKTYSISASLCVRTLFFLPFLK